MLGCLANTQFGAGGNSARCNAAGYARAPSAQGLRYLRARLRGRLLASERRLLIAKNFQNSLHKISQRVRFKSDRKKCTNIEVSWKTFLASYEACAREWAAERGWDEHDTNGLVEFAQILAEDAADRAVAGRLAAARTVDDLARIAVVLRDLPALKEKYYEQLIRRGCEIERGRHGGGDASE